MTDGPMGFQVAPITEDEMSKVHDILRRAADSIVGMSQLKEDVANLTKQVAQLSDELARLRRTNDALEETVSNHRRQRQELEGRIADYQSQNSILLNERDQARREMEAFAHDAGQYHTERDEARKDRDEAQLRVMELEDELSKARAILDKLRDALGPLVPSTPPTVGQVVQQAPTPVPEPTPEVKPTRRYLDGWQAGSIWDPEQSRYYVDEIPF